MGLTGSDMTPADFGAIMGNNGSGDGFGGGNGSGAWWLIVLFLFIFAGGFGNRGGYGMNSGSGSGAADNYVLTSDFAQVERKLDGIANGICDSTFALNNAINGGFFAAQNTMTQGFAGLNTVIGTQGYETRNAITQAQIGQMQSSNALSAQLAQCCCDNRAAISDLNYNIATQANGIGRQVERGFADTNYNMAAQNCQTLQAIDKVGDRVIDYLANKENQNLRDENFALRLAASQQAQNNYLVGQLGQKCPIPAYLTCNPNAPLNYSVNYGNGCGCA